MPAQISNEVRRKIVRMRALDYDKQEIADQLGISRNTVRRHLNDVRNEVESSDAPDMKLADILFDAQDILPYFLERSSQAIEGLDQDFVAIPRWRFRGNDEED